MTLSRRREDVDPYTLDEQFSREPPRGIGATLRHLGPGMILVGAIVGSGELIMTTKLGAAIGFVLLWFVILSCVIKAVVQAELARYTISSGNTFLSVFNTLPGPRGRRPVWLTLELLAVVIIACFLGMAVHAFSGGGMWIGIGVVLGAVTLVIGWATFIFVRRRSRPRTGEGLPIAATPERPVLNWFMWFWMLNQLILFVNGGAILGGAGQALELAFPGLLGEGGARYWAILIAVVCASLLLSGRYAALERVSIGMVTTFTFITVVCTLLLQWTGYAIRLDDISGGLSFGLPPEMNATVLLLALAMYSVTGVTGQEMISYTYWCLEKGYARNAGVSRPGEAWPRRARGWIRVMYADVLLTMVIYTTGTICFYFLGAAILHPQELNPDGTETLRVLGKVYTETLGGWATTLFVVGGFFILFSTVFSNVAAHSRVVADGLGIMRIVDHDDYRIRLRVMRAFIVIELLLFIVAYSVFENPPLMIIISSMTTVVLYPILGIGALHLRYRLLDTRIAPGRLATFWLWVCGLALAVISPAVLALVVGIRQGWIQF